MVKLPGRVLTCPRSVKRIVFESVWKFNGSTREQLSIPQLKQIAGRAGRYRSAHQDMVKNTEDPAEQRATEYKATASVGLVTCLDEADLPVIQEALRTEPPPIKTAGLLPPTEFIEEYANRLPKGLPFAYIMQRLCDMASLNPRFTLCNIRDQLKIAKIIEPIQNLTIGERCTIAASPSQNRNLTMQGVLIGLARCVATSKQVTIVDVPEIPLEVLERPLSPEREYLTSLEELHKSLILYLWLSYRFSSIFKDQDMAIHAKGLAEERINRTLLEFSANPKLRQRLQRMKESTIGTKSISPGGQVVPEGTNEYGMEGVDVSSVLPVDWTRGTNETTIDPPDLTKGQQAQANA